jgi:hypothetical protein
MKKISMLLAFLLIATMTSAFAGPVAFSLSTEAETGDLLDSDADFALGLTTSLGAAFGETGFSAGVDLTTAVQPDFVGLYDVAVYEEYDIALAGIDFAFINTNTIYVESEEDTDGYINVDATWKFVNAGFDVYYMPETAADLYFGPTYSMEAGKGTLDLSATVTYLVHPDALLGDIEGTVEYTMPVGPVTVNVGLTPTYNEILEDREFGMSVFAGVGIEF